MIVAMSGVLVGFCNINAMHQDFVDNLMSPLKENTRHGGLQYALYMNLYPGENRDGYKVVFLQNVQRSKSFLITIFHVCHLTPNTSLVQ